MFPVALAALLCLSVSSLAEPLTEHPFRGVTYIIRKETAPRPYTAHIVLIDLSTPGLRFKLTPPGGDRETVRQTALEFLQQEGAQIGVNAHFFLPFPSAEKTANLIGLAASDGKIFSDFEDPEQSYALVANAPAINIDQTNHASIIRPNTDRASLWTTLAGSARIVTDGTVTIPVYRDDTHPNGQLTEGSPSHYSNKDSWYERPQARTAIAIADAGRTLILCVIDRAAGSQGLKISELAHLLADDYRTTDALNLDGGGSSTLAIENPETHVRALANASSDNPKGRSVGSNLAVFLPQQPAPQQPASQQP